MTKTLKFYARGSAMVTDFEAMDAGVKRFVGRRFDRTLGHEVRDENGNLSKMGGWPALGHAQEVPARHEYMLTAREGDLWCADEETAAYCGVKFDPTFGGEHSPPEKSE